MNFYPIFLNLNNKSLLVVGAGSVGLRKVETVLPYHPASVLVIDPSPPSSAFLSLLSNERLCFENRSLIMDDFHEKFLVFAATNNRVVNETISTFCQAHKILCNVADHLQESDFIVPSTISDGQITLAFSTHGASPALARHLREELEAWLGNRYTALALVLKRLRPLILQQKWQNEDNSLLFRALVKSPLADLLAGRNIEQAKTLLHQLLPSSLHASIGDLLHGL